MAYFQPSTWRLLGLSVAASYVALGVIDCLMPHRAAEEFFGIAPGDAESGAVPLLLPLIGARGLSIGATLFVFARQRKYAEMGTVILAGSILCVADAVAIWRAKGPQL